MAVIGSVSGRRGGGGSVHRNAPRAEKEPFEGRGCATTELTKDTKHDRCAVMVISEGEREEIRAFQ